RRSLERGWRSGDQIGRNGGIVDQPRGAGGTCRRDGACGRAAERRRPRRKGAAAAGERSGGRAERAVGRRRRIRQGRSGGAVRPRRAGSNSQTLSGNRTAGQGDRRWQGWVVGGFAASRSAAGRRAPTRPAGRRWPGSSARGLTPSPCENGGTAARPELCR